MKNISLTIAAVALLILSGCKEADSNKETPAEVKDSVAQKPEEVTQPDVPMDSAAEAKAWEEYMTPNEMHKMLAAGDGKWDGEEMTWMAADAPATGPHKITAEYKMIMGGRYQEEIVKGDMMGMPFEGRSWTGYDNARKKFISTWVDNFGTGMMQTEGTWDEASKSITMTGKMMDPAKGKETEMRQVIKFPDDKHQIIEMYCTGKDGKEFKNMEIKLTKK